MLNTVDMMKVFPGPNQYFWEWVIEQAKKKSMQTNFKKNAL